MTPPSFAIGFIFRERGRWAANPQSAPPTTVAATYSRKTSITQILTHQFDVNPIFQHMAFDN
jgi:hypothetical protein